MLQSAWVINCFLMMYKTNPGEVFDTFYKKKHFVKYKLRAFCLSTVKAINVSYKVVVFSLKDNKRFYLGYYQQPLV